MPIITMNHLYMQLCEHIIGQPEACKAVSEVVAVAERGLKDPNKPKGTFLFLGPTGTGKTALAIALNRILYYDQAERIQVLDMADFQLQDSLKTLLGPNKQEQGLLGDLIDRLNDLGGGILLFDEIEKAHRELCNILLSILDKGSIRMSNGCIKSLHKIYIFFTSNLGGHKIARMQHSPAAVLKTIIDNEVGKFFRPEICARFDKRITFNPLSYSIKKDILAKCLNNYINLLENKLQKTITVDKSSIIPYFIDKGFHPTLGARPLLQSIEMDIGIAVTRLLDTPDQVEAITLSATDSAIIATYKPPCSNLLRTTT